MCTILLGCCCDRKANEPLIQARYVFAMASNLMFLTFLPFIKTDCTALRRSCRSLQNPKMVLHFAIARYIAPSVQKRGRWAMMSNWNGSDLPEMRLSFYSSNGETLGTTAYLPGNYTTWTLVSESIEIPLLTRMIRSELRGTRYAGTDNDSYVDDVFVQIGSESACDPSASDVNASSYARVPTKLIAYPNPGIDAVFLDFKFEASDAIVVRVSDAQGRKIQPSMEIQSNKIILYRGSLPRGMYYVSVIGQNGSLATSTIIFE